MAWLRSGLCIGATLVAGGVIERFSRRSGATDAEANGPLPGDDVIAHPTVEWTRATTIGATPDRVWPWLVQMGYGRGGWYTNERLDQLVWRTSAPDSGRLEPQWQQLEVGDIVADGPDHAAYFHVEKVEPGRALVYHSIRHPFRGHPVDPTDRGELERLEARLVSAGTYLDFSWAFVLRPDRASSSRLIIRTRADFAPASIGLARVPLGFVDLFHAHTMLRTIGHHVEHEGQRSVTA